MFEDFLSLLFPRLCELCDQGLARGEKMICLKCYHNLPRFENDLPQEDIFMYFTESHRYRAFYAYLKFHKRGIAQKLLHKIKYGRKPILGEIIGHRLGSAIYQNERDLKIDLVVPIPLHPVKKKKRGYNQSDFFARGLAGALYTDWSSKELRRIENNETQTHKSRDERIMNVEGIFQVKRKDKIEGKHIMLVDDVVTTGATLESCAREIGAAGSKSISLAALAVAK